MISISPSMFWSVIQLFLQRNCKSDSKLFYGTPSLKNGNRRYKYLVLVHDDACNPDSKSKYSEDDTIKMLEFLIDIIFVIFKQILGTHLQPTSFSTHTKRNSYSLCSRQERNIISVQFHVQIHRRFVHKQPRDWEIPAQQMYPIELETIGTTWSNTSVSYLRPSSQATVFESVFYSLHTVAALSEVRSIWPFL